MTMLSFDSFPGGQRCHLARVCAFIASVSTLAVGVSLTGCASDLGDLRAPQAIVAPFDSAYGEPLWAIAPPRNESGTTAVSVDQVADALVAAVQEARGLSCVPYNRTLEAMAVLGMDRITSAAEATALARAMNVDGILVPSVTAWNPYDPPTVGLTIALFPLDSSAFAAPDLNTLVRAGSDAPGTSAGGLGAGMLQANPGPTSVVSEHMDAHRHDVLMAVREYAEGRSTPRTANGWRMYTASSELFLRFAAHEVVRKVVRDETLRLSRLSRRWATQDRVADGASPTP